MVRKYDIEEFANTSETNKNRTLETEPQLNGGCIILFILAAIKMILIVYLAR